jgi:hypothetical protein
MRIVPVIAIRKSILNRISKCASDPKQERRRGKGNDDNADLMYKPHSEESNISIEEQSKKNPSITLKPSPGVLVNEYSDGFKAVAQNEEELVAVTQLEISTKTLKKTDATLLPTRLIDGEKMGLIIADHFKTLDELLEKAEQVIRLLEIEKQEKDKSADDTKWKQSHNSEVVDQSRADNDFGKSSPQEELRAYLRRAVAEDFHRVGFNCDDEVINKFVEDLILDQEREMMEEENPIIEENYVMPKGNFMSYKWTGGYDPPKKTPSIENSGLNQQPVMEEGRQRQQLYVKRNPIDPDVRRYYLELLLTLTYDEQGYILNSIIADELYKEGWSQDEAIEYVSDLMNDYEQMVEDQSESKLTGDINVGITPPNHGKIVDFIRRKYLLKMKEPEELTAEEHNVIMNNMRWELVLVGLSPRAINQQSNALIEDNYQLLTAEAAASAAMWEPQPNKRWGSVRMPDAYDLAVEEPKGTPVDDPVVISIRRKYLLKMKELEVLSRQAQNIIMKDMAYELYEAGLSPSEVDKQFDALIEDNYQWLAEAAAASTTIREPAPEHTPTRVVPTSPFISPAYDTPFQPPVGNFCIGTPELVPSKRKVVLRERKRTQTSRNKKNTQMRTTETISKRPRRKKGRPMRRQRTLQQLPHWQSTYHHSAILIINLSAMATLVLLNALFQQHILTVCRVTEQGGGWYPFCDGKWRVENDRIS